MGQIDKAEFASWLALGKAPATYSQWKAGSSMCPEAGQARPQKPLKRGFSPADLTQTGPAEPPAPRHQPMCEFGLTVQFGGFISQGQGWRCAETKDPRSSFSLAPAREVSNSLSARVQASWRQPSSALQA